MKKITFVCAAVFLLLSVKASCGEFKDSGAAFSADFPPGWKEGKSNDPSVTLRLEKGRAFFEFAKLDSELSDYYLKARVKEQVDSLRSKGSNLAGDIKPVSLHGISSAYYTSYESIGNQCYIAFFTYNGASYAISASGLDEGDFRAVMATLRKPGEKIEIPKPKKIRAAKNKKAEDEESGAQLFKEDEAVVLTASAAAQLPAVSAGQFPARQTESAPAEPTLAEKADVFLSELEAKRADAGLSPYFNRKPLNIMVWVGIVLFWLAGSFFARAQAAVYQPPRLPPPPKDVPPDFFFPFLVSCERTLKDVTYNIITRQKQLLQAGFQSGHEVYFVAAVYGALLFNFVWSLLALSGRAGLVTGSLLILPGGRFLASFPETFCLIFLLIGIVKYRNKKQVLQLFDAQSNLVLEVKKEVAYGLLRDAKGKEIARLAAKTGATGRMWEYVDSDNLVVFSIRDDCPKIHFMRHIFGNLGGALRARYGIFVQERRAGFVFLDPHSSNRFQIHMDFNFARLAHPAHILASLLYITSKEKDPLYPSPF